MINLAEDEDCCGCGACVNVCPRRCIAMQENREGFLYPEVDAKRCINCGLCEKVCPLLKNPTQHEVLAVFGAKNLDDVVRSQSSSGGMFSLFAQKVLEEGGVVFGAALDAELGVRHIAVRDKEQLCLLRGSKYVQSVTGTVYREVRTELKKGEKVLFSGTPCQTAALRYFLGSAFANLVTVDVVCHGVPSPLVYRKHLNDLALLAGEPVVQVRFRDKEKGWKGGETLFLTRTRRFGAAKRKEPYMRLFLKNVSIRPCCGSCLFNNRRNLADLTIADYWGIDRQYPSFDDDRGVTLVIVNTAKGMAMLKSVSCKAEMFETTFAEGAEYNLAVAKSLPLHPAREFFFANLERYTLAEFAEMLL